jgi:hypothetical protein
MKIFVAVWAFVGLLLTGAVATAQPAKPTIVLVHALDPDQARRYIRQPPAMPRSKRKLRI